MDQLKKAEGNKNGQWSEEPGLPRKMGRIRFKREIRLELDSIEKTKDARRNNNPSNTFKN